MPSLRQLQQERAQMQNELKRRGGLNRKTGDNIGFVDRERELRQQINQMKAQQPQGPANAPAQAKPRPENPGKDLREMQAQREQLQNEIERRGGRDKAAGFNQKLQNLDMAIRGNDAYLAPKDRPQPQSAIPRANPQQMVADPRQQIEGVVNRLPAQEGSSLPINQQASNVAGNMAGQGQNLGQSMNNAFRQNQQGPQMQGQWPGNKQPIQNQSPMTSMLSSMYKIPRAQQSMGMNNPQSGNLNQFRQANPWMKGGR